MDPEDVTPEELQKYKMAFQILDKDNDGKISRDQFEGILKRAVGGSESTEDVEAVLQQMNADENGDVSFQGFLSAMVATRDEDMSVICCSAEDLLKDLGADKDKTLGVADWKKLLDNLGICFTEEEIEAVINKVNNMPLKPDDDVEYETADENSAEETTASEEDEKEDDSEKSE